MEKRSEGLYVVFHLLTGWSVGILFRESSRIIFFYQREDTARWIGVEEQETRLSNGKKGPL